MTDKSELHERGIEAARNAFQKQIGSGARLPYRPAVEAAIHAYLAIAQQAPVSAVPTEQQINSACMSYRHDFGLVPRAGQEALRRQAKFWLEAWQKEFPALASPPPPAQADDLRNAAECVVIAQHDERLGTAIERLETALEQADDGKDAEIARLKVELAEALSWVADAEDTRRKTDALIRELVTALESARTWIIPEDKYEISSADDAKSYVDAALARAKAAGFEP